jgi:hypothetical protein
MLVEKFEGRELMLDTHHWDKSWLKDVAIVNIPLIAEVSLKSLMAN